ncbi:Putative alpha/Beta hydrolase [Septoria linicola]|uniref:Alpha/Beta hydrolase n=1 Tax=Septoria linicola TaxID=215465 RepID=A0A9Q9AWF5_9PEZI|nr:putative alpha/Beta hydrolase [Septoria linicola]USW53202.1 Putative alpha/Beta hydrolase [Septoria linicola]
MTVLFQDKIIYMPYMPPYARKEKVEAYAAICKPVSWEHLHIKSLDGTRIALCVGSMMGNEAVADNGRKRKVVICYFQGNGSSTPPRLPLLSNTLKAIEARALEEEGQSANVEFMLVALSYRGYWTSSGRASQKGIEKDAQAMLQWVITTQAAPRSELEIILWGQSIGAGVASTAAAQYLATKPSKHPTKITGLVLETPFTGIKSMLLALYPQKWLPYQYLWPFLWNHWDSQAALQSIARVNCPPRVLLMPATRDEVVPPSEADKLDKISRDAGLRTQRTDIIGALHTEATTRREGQVAVAEFVVDCIKTGK